MDGVAFKKTFSYAGFEQQPKSFNNPKILLLNIELELKAEKENAEVGADEGACEHELSNMVHPSLALVQGGELVKGGRREGGGLKRGTLKSPLDS